MQTEIRVGSGLALNRGPGLIGWGLQVRLIRANKAYKGPQMLTQPFYSVALAVGGCMGSDGVAWLVLSILGEES